jgi:hypothetical protein
MPGSRRGRIEARRSASLFRLPARPGPGGLRLTPEVPCSPWLDIYGKGRSGPKFQSPRNLLRRPNHRNHHGRPSRQPRRATNTFGETRPFGRTGGLLPRRVDSSGREFEWLLLGIIPGVTNLLRCQIGEPAVRAVVVTVDVGGELVAQLLERLELHPPDQPLLEL